MTVTVMCSVREKEDAHMKLIAEEFKKRDKHREDFMKQKVCCN